MSHDPAAVPAYHTARRHPCQSGLLLCCYVPVQDIAGIGITNQRETTVIWDRRTGEPLYDAVVWLDSRTRETVASLKHVFETPDHLRDQCGLPLSTYFSGVKLRWLLDNVPAVKAAVGSGDAMFGTVDSWLVWKLTGGATHATDFTNASRTMLMDIGSREWSVDCAAALGIESMMGATALAHIPGFHRSA